MSTPRSRTSDRGARKGRAGGRASSKRGSGALVSRQRKVEVLGLVLMVLAVLLALAVGTRTAADDGRVAEVQGFDVFRPGGNHFDNLIGPVGAVLARGLVTGFLGYPVLGLIAALGAWGYVLFRQKKVVWLPLLTTLAAFAALLAACFAGWGFTVREAAGLEPWAGAVGLGAAGWLVAVLKPVGAFVLLALAAAVTTLLVVDHDIQTSLDRAEGAAKRARLGLTEGWAAFRTGAAERRERQADALAQRRARVAESRAAREAGRETAPVQQKRAPVADHDGEDRPPQTVGVERPAREERPPAVRPPLPPPVDEPAPVMPDLFAGGTGDGVENDPVLDDLIRSHRAADPVLHVSGPVEEEPADLDATPRAPKLTRDQFRALYTFPSLDLLDQPDARLQVDMGEIEDNKRVLLDKLDTYNIEITEINAVVGPTVTRYELTPAPGVKISRITALEDDLAMALAAPGIRIIAPIPGKSAIGVEIPNRSRELVRLRSLLATPKFRDAARTDGGKGAMALPVCIGKSIEGEVFLEDLTRMPHLLIAGATGSGKSVGLNTLIAGLLYACHPADLKLVMVDPKKIELNAYAALLDHFIAMPEDADEPITTDFAQAAGVLRSCEREMERRYDRLAEAGVRGIREYNEKVAAGKLPEEHRHLPYIVVVIDELADLMMTSGKEVEAPIARLAQMARAVGVHLVIATQRPSVDVITGLIKANFPSRMAYQVASRIDSRTILDQGGAHHLIGNGDLLYMNGSRITRLQGPFLSVEEVEAVVKAIGQQPGPGPYLLPPLETTPDGHISIGGASADGDERDPLFEEAARAIVRNQQGSVSLLQRKLSIGYTRAARIVDQLEDAGVVGPFEGSKAREVLITSEPQLDELLAAQRD